MSCWRCTTPGSLWTLRSEPEARVSWRWRPSSADPAGEPGLEGDLRAAALPTTTTSEMSRLGEDGARLGEERLGDDRDLGPAVVQEYR